MATITLPSYLLKVCVKVSQVERQKCVLSREKRMQRPRGEREHDVVEELIEVYCDWDRK